MLVIYLYLKASLPSTSPRSVDETNSASPTTRIIESITGNSNAAQVAASHASECSYSRDFESEVKKKIMLLIPHPYIMKKK